MIENYAFGAEYHASVTGDYTLAEVAAAGGKISRVRMFREMGYYDVSYIHAEVNGQTVRVNLSNCPRTHLIPGNKVMATFIEWGKAEGVFAKGINLLNRGCWDVL